jgi:hypothetical protein
MSERYLTQHVVDMLKSLITEHGSWRKAKPHALSILPTPVPTTQQIYDAVHAISEDDRVAPCGKEKRFDGFWGGYRFCGSLKTCPCAAANTRDKSELTFVDRYGVKRPLQNAEIMKKTKATNLKRYGVECVLKNPEVVAATKATNLERYGSESAASSKKVKAKIKATNLERYGASCTLQTEEVKKKTKKTVLDRYGVDHIAKSPVIKEQIRTTNVERYGVEMSLQSPEIKEKAKHSMMRRFGFENAWESSEIQDRIKNTNLERYGVEKPFQSADIQRVVSDSVNQRYGRPVSSLRISEEAYRILSSEHLLVEICKDKSFREVAALLDVSYEAVTARWRGYGLPAPKSSYETEISGWLDSIGIEYHSNTRKIIGPMELDFFLPDHGIGIEFNGLYWHSKVETDYHRKKYEACREAGVHLVMVNEDEWINRSSAIKSRIKHLMGKSDRGVGARKLTVCKITGSAANAFFDSNHIQGKTGTISFAVGSYHEDRLVAAMAFNNQRGTGRVELIRFCSDGKSYPGIFSKMFKHSVNEMKYSTVLSFADLRYSTGDVYRKNGFALVHETKPDYRYVWRNQTYHKSSFTKAKIADRFGIDMSDLTEKNAMEELGIPRIYDCGKLKFVWTREGISFLVDQNTNRG